MKFNIIYYYYEEKIRNKKRREFPPLGALYIAATLEQEGHDVTFCMLHSNDDICSVPQSDINLYTISSAVVYPFLKRSRFALEGKAKIHAAGGAQVNACPKTVLEDMDLDAVFTNFSENSTKQWAKSGCEGKGIIESIPIDIDLLPLPARHLLEEHYIYLNNRVGGHVDNCISLITSRGCAWSCNFCAANNGRKVLLRGPEQIEYEIKTIFKNYSKVAGFVLLDENLTHNETHALNVSRILRKTTLPWECNSRADSINKQTALALAKGGCKEIRIGMESGSPKMLKLMNKRESIQTIRNAIITSARAGLNVKVYIMHGYPGENKNTTNETINELTKLKKYISRVGLYRFTPLPGSSSYLMLKLSQKNWEHYSIYNKESHWFTDSTANQDIEESFFLLKTAISNLFK